MAVSIIGPKFYAWDRNGKPLAGGKLYTYQSKTNTPKVTYQSEDQEVENSNPVILNGEGYANVYLKGSYKMVLKDGNDNEIWTSDLVSSYEASEWTNCLSATYISPTSFKVAGNFTGQYDVGRRVRLSDDSGGYDYSTIDEVMFSAGETTIKVKDPIVKTNIVGSCISIVGVDSLTYSSSGVPSIKDLESIPNPIDKSQIYVNGFYDGAVTGGGQFIWDESKDKSLHNGGTVISPEAIAAWDGSQVDLASLLNWTGTGTGCFVRLSIDELLNEVSDLMFGAVCDGNSNDFFAGQALLNSGAEYVVFSKNFNTESQINIPPSVKMLTSKNALIKNSLADNNKSVFYGSGLSGISLKDIHIQPPLINSESSLQGAAICIWDSSEVSIQNIIIEARGNSDPEGDAITLVRTNDVVLDKIFCKGAAYNADDIAVTQNLSPQTISFWQGGSNINVSNISILGGWGFGIKFEISSNGDSPSNFSVINISNAIIDGVHGHGYLLYTDDIQNSFGYTINDVKMVNCHFKNGTGKMYNKNLGERIYGIGFYNQGGKNVSLSNTSVKNSQQNTVTSSINPIPAAAYGSTNGSMEIVNGLAYDTYKAPAININSQRDQAGIYDGVVKVVNFRCKNNDSDGNDASMRFTQCSNLTLDNVDVERSDNIAPSILIDSTGSSGNDEYTGIVNLRNVRTKKGKYSVEVIDCSQLNIDGGEFSEAGNNGILLNNVSDVSISTKITDYARDSASSGISAIAGSSDAIGNGIRIARNNILSISSGSATGMALSVPFIAGDNVFNGITSLYTSTYGYERSSTDTATPDVYGCSTLKSDSSTQTAITDLVNGFDGQVVTIIQTSGSRVISSTSTIKPASGSASITLVSPQAATFKKRNLVWYKI